MRIRCAGRDVVGHATENIAQFGIGYVPEDRRMFPGLTVRENFRLAALGSRMSKADQQAAPSFIGALDHRAVVLRRAARKQVVAVRGAVD